MTDKSKTIGDRETDDIIADLKAERDRRRQARKALEPNGGGATAQATGAPLTTISIVQGEIPRVVNEAETALLELGLELYQYGVRLVEAHLVLTKTSGGREFLRWRLPEVTTINLVEYFSLAARFERFDKRSKDWVRVDPPDKIAAAYLARKKKRVPHIAGIVNTPFLRADGTICDREGYDPTTAVLCKWEGVSFPPVPLKPTKKDALAALAVLEKPIAEFPFVTPADRSAALSGILTPLDRKGVDIVPAHGITSPSAGTGKGLLEDIIAVIATGRPMPSDNQGPDEEEQEKRLGASLIAGDSLISIDNCERPLEGACISSAVTQHIVEVRVLGKSKKVECPNTASIFANGNNLIIGADMTRRVIRCEMDAEVERPETRKFKVNRLLKTVQANRIQLVIAGLTILRAWLLARPTEPVELTPLDFEEWSARVRSAIVWLGRPDPGDTMQASRDNDPYQVQRSVVFAEWHRVIGEREGLQRDIIEAAIGDQTFQVALLAIAARPNDREISPERLGKWLPKNKGKIAGSFRLVFCANTNKGPRWRVEPAGGQPSGKSNESNGQDGEDDLAL